MRRISIFPTLPMRTEPTEKNAMLSIGTAIAIAFIALFIAEYLLESGDHPDRWHLSFPEPEGRTLDFELCQSGSDSREFSYTLSVDKEKMPRSGSSLHVDAHGCATAAVPEPSALPEEEQTVIRILVTDDAGRRQSLSKVLR